MPDHSVARTPARDLKPGDRILWNGDRLTVERIEVRSAPWVSGGTAEVRLDVSERTNPVVIIPASAEVQRA